MEILPPAPGSAVTDPKEMMTIYDNLLTDLLAYVPFPVPELISFCVEKVLKLLAILFCFSVSPRMHALVNMKLQNMSLLLVQLKFPWV